MASMPSTRGMTRSTSATSGSRRATACTASSPSAASPTTSTSSWRARKARRPSRTTAWSSAMRTRITAAPRARRSSRRRGASRCSACRPSARARSSIDVRPRRRERRPGSSGSKPTPSSATATRRWPSIASSRTSTWLASAWRRAFCSASWAMRRTSAAPARGSASPSRLERDRVAVDALQHVDVLAQRGGQPLALGLRRAQLEDQRAQLLHRLARELLQALQLGLGLGRCRGR